MQLATSLTLDELKLVGKHSVNNTSVGSNRDSLRISTVGLEAAGHGEETASLKLALVRNLKLRARDDESTRSVTCN